ncbi:ubiquinol-cytochrome C chaperone family protein [Aliihoeflea sp. PC F10.4]
MFSRLFGKRRNENARIVGKLYDRVVVAARQPTFYADWNVPDTPLGRYEMMALHMFLFLHRTRSATGSLAEVAQELTDEFFKDVDHSLRELGIGDVGVPKRMKKLARMFYGRAESYGAAVDAGDRAVLMEALSRNILPGGEPWPQAGNMADYIMASVDALRGQSDDALAAGEVVYLPADAAAQQEGSAA